MTSVPLGIDAYNRMYAQEPVIEVRNRFFERTPANQVDGVDLLSRPVTAYLETIGSAPLRRLHTQPGSFDGDLFAFMGDSLYRYNGVDAPALIASGLNDSSTPSFAVMKGQIALVEFEYLFVNDGLNLYYYEGETYATGVLTGTVADTDTIAINSTYYEWTSGSVNAGTPDGSLANPFLVALGGDNTTALANMLAALNFTGTSGTTYSTTLGGANADVFATASDATTLSVRARTRGTSGNAITTAETGAALAWGGATLSGGGVNALSQVTTPDDVAISSIAPLATHVVAVQANSGRFYWIEPGQTVIDPLNFATAEQSPDNVVEVIAVGDQIWFLGQDSIEPWYASGSDPAFVPSQGRVFADGMFPGTAVEIDNFVILVGNDNIVYKVGGGIEQISNHGIEEKIRIARKALGI